MAECVYRVHQSKVRVLVTFCVLGVRLRTRPVWGVKVVKLAPAYVRGVCGQSVCGVCECTRASADKGCASADKGCEGECVGL